ncbi:MAG: TlpA disulfide reductase family protein [Balneolales bacterium]
MSNSTSSLLLISAFILLTSACSNDDPRSEDDSSLNRSADDPPANHSVSGLEKAPDFEVTTIDGEKISLQATIDEEQPLVIYFTASWCPVCARNWPVLSELYPDYKDRLNLVAIGIDPDDDEAVMRKLSREQNFTFPVTAGIPGIMEEFGVTSQATTVGINRDGYITFKTNKSALSAEEFRALFDGLLNQTRSNQQM